MAASEKRRRTEMVAIRMTPDERRTVQSAARAYGISVGRFTRQAALARAADPPPDEDHCYTVEVDGEPVRLRGNPDEPLSEETSNALADVIRAAKRAVAAMPETVRAEHERRYQRAKERAKFRATHQRPGEHGVVARDTGSNQR